MSKTVPIALANHQALPATTLCFVQKIGPLPGGGFITLTSLDRDVVFDDGNGPLTYRASTGMQLSELASTHGLEVDNGETQTLMPVYPVEGITEAMVDSGDLDYAEFTIFKINYLAPSNGGEIMANGPIGEVRIVDGGLITFENRSWSQLMKQNSVCERDSLTCRVKRFGSQPGEERFPCNYDLTAEWINGTVTAVGAETVRDFTASALGQTADYFAPGLVNWLTGANAGMSREIESFGVGGVIALGFTTRNPIAVNDTFRIRRDCTRQWSGHNSCQTYNNRQWFRGEPFIPVSDTIALTIPGAGGGNGLSSGTAAV